ncbi:MAG TPA: Sir2 family NAD+-dependent deacetylase [Candidatus Baltobacteraceae bacterium]|nr:Sir2 family NAD+-dependent deacetylase [Candidatus Baltobacteraceae bacterium]
MKHIRSIVVLTGAGISVESGLSTFRDHGGLWCNHRIEDVATPEAFERDPKLVQDFYNMRRAQLKEVEPNAAHRALAELAGRWDGDFLLVTQNVDDLHERALIGKTLRAGFGLLHMHGELAKARCVATGRVYDWTGDITLESKCTCCNEAKTLRPHIVWFGEMPLQLDRVYAALQKCDLFVSIGTSGNVYPAAGLVQEVREVGRGRAIELNLEPSLDHTMFDERIYGNATRIVPEFVAKVLAAQTRAQLERKTGHGFE